MNTHKEISLAQWVKILQFDDPMPKHSLKLIVDSKPDNQFSIQPSDGGSFDTDNLEISGDETLIVEHNLDDSLEMAMMEHTIDASQRVFYEQEKAITGYLKTEGIRFKTDPRSKQDKYFIQKKRRQQKALTTFQAQPIQQIFQQQSNHLFTPNLPSTRFMDLQNNSIMQRRTPQCSPVSSPLLESKSATFKQDQGKKSRFFMIQKQE